MAYDLVTASCPCLPPSPAKRTVWYVIVNVDPLLSNPYHPIFIDRGLEYLGHAPLAWSVLKGTR